MNHDNITQRCLDVIENEILPMTERGVGEGNKVFGAAILRKSDLSTVIAETNNELENPLWHGEVHTLKRFYEMPEADRPNTSECIFLSTHEPCTMCMSAITWAGFDNYFYFFSHEDSRDSFAIPHDLKILKELFDLEPGGYRRENAFWSAHNLIHSAAQFEENARDQASKQISAIRGRYNALSDQYQETKSDNSIPLN